LQVFTGIAQLQKLIIIVLNLSISIFISCLMVTVAKNTMS
jgi:hypothetical protein